MDERSLTQTQAEQLKDITLGQAEMTIKSFTRASGSAFVLSISIRRVPSTPIRPCLSRCAQLSLSAFTGSVPVQLLMCARPVTRLKSTTTRFTTCPIQCFRPCYTQSHRSPYRSTQRQVGSRGHLLGGGA